MDENNQNRPLDLSFEQALKELESIVRQLEDGNTPLENSLKLYERGQTLRMFCEESLQKARVRIEEIASSQLKIS
jgi:exodeoxyribonuclease VII small subunit